VHFSDGHRYRRPSCAELESCQISKAGRRRLLAGVGFLLSCSLLALAAGLPGWAALLVVVAAVAVHTLGEIWHLAGGFAVRMSLARPSTTEPEVAPEITELKPAAAAD
jgi:hypothetical protein